MFAQLLQGMLPGLFSVIEEAVEDKDEANRLKAQIQMQLLSQQGRLEEISRDVIVSEAQGESWLQRNWRPLIMLMFAGFIGSYWLGFAPPYLQENPEVATALFTLIQIGLGGYVFTRSGEKGLRTYTEGQVRIAEANARAAEAQGQD